MMPISSRRARAFSVIDSSSSQLSASLPPSPTSSDDSLTAVLLRSTMPRWSTHCTKNLRRLDWLVLWQESTSSLSEICLAVASLTEGSLTCRVGNRTFAAPIQPLGAHDLVHSVVPRGLGLGSRGFRTALSVIAAKFSPVTVRPQWLRCQSGRSHPPPARGQGTTTRRIWERNTIGEDHVERSDPLL